MGIQASAEQPRLDFDNLWDYQKPAETEQKFRALLPQAREKGLSYFLQLETQIARTLSLQAKFGEAYQILAEVSSELPMDADVAKIRYLLELGRTQNSEKKTTLAASNFHAAFTLADHQQEWGYAVDALHMLAIASSENPQEKLDWEKTAIAYAESKDSTSAKGWLGSLYFNAGWSNFALTHYQEALDTFTKAYNLDRTNGSPDWILLDDRRTVAQMKRLVGLVDEALQEELQLQRENFDKLGKPDGFVFEELAELYLAKHEEEKARDYFARAYPLVKDQLTEPKDQERLARIKRFAGE